MINRYQAHSDILKALFRSEGFFVMNARNGLIGNRIMKDIIPDLIVLDRDCLQNRDCLRGVYRLKTAHPEIVIFCILDEFTTLSEKFIDITRKLGVSCMLQKSFKRKEILHLLNKHLGNEEEEEYASRIPTAPKELEYSLSL